MACTHTRTIPGHWEDGEYSDDSEWVHEYEKSTVVDVDLHRYKCTQCGQMMYYSKAARDYYERGINNHIAETAGQ
jgi:hypothetical protein